MNVQELYKKRLVSPEEAIKRIQSNSEVSLACGLAAPPAILEALAQNYQNYENVKFYQAIGLLPHRYFMEEAMAGHFVKESLYNAAPDRAANAKNLSTILDNTIHLSESGRFMTQWRNVSVFLGTAAPMNKWGYLSLGTSTIYEKEALEKADIVILEVNENIPFTHGDAIVHISEVDLVVENHVPMIEVQLATPNEKDTIIARYISDLVPDGATLQLGIGGVPAAVAIYLTDKKNLGVHTELLVDSYVDLWEAGVVTNLDKTLEKGKMIGCLAIGTKKLWNFMDHNPIVELRKGSFTNSVPIMSQNTKLISINMSMQADFYGQCASESLGAVQYSATGGQLDWVRGAQLSPGGKSIICFYSTAKNDTISKIVPAISDGSAITTPRADIDYVVTEYGVAHLKGKPFSERAELMIQIAHPKFRAQLEEEAKRLRIIR